MTSRSRLHDVLEGAKPVMLMVTVQVLCAGIYIFYKIVADDGMNLKIVVSYRFLFATAVMVPLALIFERNKRPKLTWMILLQAFCCGVLGGTLGQNLYLASVALTTATYATAIINLIPAITFVLAFFLGLEKLDIRRVEGIAKLMGTLMGIGGAMALTFYKGLEIHLWSTHINLVNHGGHGSSKAPSGNRVLGFALAVACCFSSALFLIVQTKLAARYPCHLSSTALQSVMALVQSTVFALCRTGNWSEWKLGWNIRLLAVSYMGIMGSGFSVALLAWSVQLRGPLFGSVFNPLALILVATAGSLLLNEKLYLGSVLGSLLIVAGLYVVLWGKSKELKRINQILPSKSCYSPSEPTVGNEHVIVTECNNLSVANSASPAVKKDNVSPELNPITQADHEEQGRLP